MVTKSITGASAILLAAAVAIAAYWTALSGLGIIGDGRSSGGSTVSDGMRVDSATGFAFPSSHKFKVGKDLSLLGVGTRKKAIINVYSVGFYGGKGVTKAIEDKSGKDASNAVISSKGPRAALLTFAMGVGAEKMAEALTNIEGVKQSTKDAFGDMILNGIGGKLKKGESMTLEWKGSDTVIATARGQVLGEMKDKDLFTGLLKVYLGPKSVSPSLRANIGAE
mmetsp:Transcript_916/g.2117  ORF Transcript_916/g.2117 Transcript_916/m.2117 type:complete len:223 (-) Transcript_916:87-755(-)